MTKEKPMHGWHLHPLTWVKLDATACGRISTRTRKGMNTVHLDQITEDESKMNCVQCLKAYKIMHENREWIGEQSDPDNRRGQRRKGSERRSK